MNQTAAVVLLGGGSRPAAPKQYIRDSSSFDPGIDMKAWLEHCNLFLRIRKAALTLEYSLLLAVILAGAGGVLIALSDRINEPIVRVGASIAANETPGSESRE